VQSRLKPIEIIRFCPGSGFSMSESCIDRIGRSDIFKDIWTIEGAEKAVAPVLVIPAAGSWNFGTEATGDLRGLQLLDEFMPQLKHLKNLRVLFDCGGEGFVWWPDMHNYLERRLGELGLKRDQVFLLTSRIDPQQGYLDWCTRMGLTPLMTHLYSPVQLYLCSGVHRKDWTTTKIEQLILERSPFGVSGNKLREKNYLCLNYSPREGRYATGLELLDRDLLSKGLVSFYGRTVNNGELDPPPELETIVTWLRALNVDERLIARLPEFDAMCPLTLDDPTADRMTKAYGAADQGFYADTYVSFVTESDFFGQAGPRFTEKVLKPMANLHPFVVVGTQFIIKELKALGFQSFSPWIDESYDDIEDPAKRLRAALDECVRLASMSRYELHETYTQLWPRLLHNYLHYHIAVPSLVDTDAAFRKLSDLHSF
jgi:hypothetical protein